ncbi:MAG: glutamyl-tRNA reductase [Myxococcales bacterium]|nr:glutamyl-tRNA reductase [Myxococcales bacterium]
MTDLFVVGLSHHTAPVNVREKVASGISQTIESVQRLVKDAHLIECLLVSTCNRIEIYGYSQDVAMSAQRVRDQLAICDSSIASHLYEHVGSSAVLHAFRVASSLDSMVIGEPQILGQVKRAITMAQTAGTLHTVLGRAFQHAIKAAKQVRSDTGIASGAVSISSMAVDLASRIFGNLEQRHVLLVGAGKMGESAVKILTGRGAELVIVNRSPTRGAALAKRFGGACAPYEHLQEKLALVDIAITSTGSSRPIIDVEMIRQVVKIRRHRPLFLIDLAVPRDVDPMVAKNDGVYVYDLDDLQKLTEANLQTRRAEVRAAEQLLQVHVASFERWREALRVAPTIAALRKQVHTVVRAEVARLGKHMNPQEQAQWSDCIVNKLLHHPVQKLKARTHPGTFEHEIAVVRELFSLDDTEEENS